MLKHGKVRRGYLGISTQPVRLPAALDQQLGQEIGLLIMAVESNSPAKQGGLLLSDTLVALTGSPIEQHDDLLALLNADRVGVTIPVRLVRGGQVQEVSVVIGERGEGDGTSQGHLTVFYGVATLCAAISVPDGMYECHHSDLQAWLGLPLPECCGAHSPHEWHPTDGGGRCYYWRPGLLHRLFYEQLLAIDIN